MIDGPSMDDDNTIERLAREARAQRGGKPAKYIHLEQFGEIEKLVAADVQLPFILKWLADEKKVSIVLNTLRKYVIFKIGRPAYDEYLKRNGWFKTKKTEKSILYDMSSPTSLQAQHVSDDGKQLTKQEDENPKAMDEKNERLPQATTSKRNRDTDIKSRLQAMAPKTQINDGNHVPHTKFEIDEELRKK